MLLALAKLYSHPKHPPGEHEASRRMKTELLVQLDGLARRADERVFVLVRGCVIQNTPTWVHSMSVRLTG